jgi:hypothetical protein
MRVHPPEETRVSSAPEIQKPLPANTRKSLPHGKYALRVRLVSKAARNHAFGLRHRPIYMGNSVLFDKERHMARLVVPPEADTVALVGKIDEHV